MFVFTNCLSVSSIGRLIQTGGSLHLSLGRLIESDKILPVPLVYNNLQCTCNMHVVHDSHVTNMQ